MTQEKAVKCPLKVPILSKTIKRVERKSRYNEEVFFMMNLQLEVLCSRIGSVLLLGLEIPP